MFYDFYVLYLGLNVYSSYCLCVCEREIGYSFCSLSRYLVVPEGSVDKSLFLLELYGSPSVKIQLAFLGFFYFFFFNLFSFCLLSMLERTTNGLTHV